jgi:hypothetical protein
MTPVTFACGHTLRIGLTPKDLAHKVRHLSTLECHDAQIWPLLHGARDRAERAKAVRDRLTPILLDALAGDPSRCELVRHFKAQQKPSFWLARRFWNIDRLIDDARRSIEIPRPPAQARAAENARQIELAGA